MGREMGGRFKKEGAYVYLCLIHVDVWQKPTHYCKVIIFLLKINKFKKLKARRCIKHRKHLNYYSAFNIIL